MARLIVYARNIPGDESHKRGDVISVRNDNEPVGGDIENGVLLGDGSRMFLWRIVSVPGDKSEYEHLTERILDYEDIANVYPMRSKRVDLDLIEGAAVGAKGEAIVSGEPIAASREGLLAVTLNIPPKSRGMFLPE